MKHYGSLTLAQNSEFGTVKEFYNSNESILDVNLSKRTPGSYTLKGPFIFLEVTIMVDEVHMLAFNLRSY